MNIINQHSRKRSVMGIMTLIAITFSVLLLSGCTEGEVDEEKTTTNKVIEEKRQEPKITINADDRIKGDKNAPITLIEFSDFQCPFCKKFHPTMQKVMEEYEGKVRWVYRHFPLSIHQNAQKSAEASECAGEQDKFWEYLDKAFENSEADGTGLNTEDLKKYAEELSLDTDEFNECLSSGKFADKVKADMDSGKKLGISGTPGSILIDEDGNSELIKGALPFELIKEQIDAALK